MYDYIIVGAGPSGLALAQILCKDTNLKILIIDKEKTVGGCHRVRRTNNGHFTEHGPRIYSNVYLTFKTLLNDMGLKFEDLFVPYNFNIAQISGQTAFNVLQFRELVAFAVEYFWLLFNNTHGSNSTVGDFMHKNNFHPKSVDMIDRICRLTDGAGKDKYTLNEFLQLLNMNFFYQLYQPRTPNDNDEGVFVQWKRFLESKGNVDFLLDTNVTQITKGTVVIQGKEIKTDKIILAIPPKNIATFYPEKFTKYAEETAYIDYISVTYHWKNTKLKQAEQLIYGGFTESDWGIVFIVLSNYMIDLPDTLISVAVTITDRKSRRINLTADECVDEDILKREIFSQLQESLMLPEPDLVILSPGNYHDGKRWISKDTSFIASANFSYLPFEIEDGVFNLGTHNGKHKYLFTSLESAVSNSVALAHKLGHNHFQIESGWTLAHAIRILVLLLILIAFILIKFI